MQLHLIQLKDYSILKQLELEEALLRADSRSFCLLNRGTCLTCVLGISSKLDEMLHVEEAKKKGVGLIRRFSGGGTVIVDEDTMFCTFILNQHHNTDTLHQFATQVYTPFFSPLPFSFYENDYRLGDRKIGGNAQYFTKNRSLHHTSFLYDWKKERMDLLKLPPKMPSYRQQRTHQNFLSPLKDHFSSKESFMDGLVKQLNQLFNLVSIGVDELDEVLKRPHRKSIEQIFYQ